MYLKVNKDNSIKFPYSLAELKKENPNVSFPAKIEEKILSDFNVYAVKETAIPNFDSKTHRVLQEVNSINNTWMQQWSIVELPRERAEANVRALRNKSLTESDWTQLTDSPLSADAKLAWALYRETLRMIPQQAGFPYSVQWPPMPQ